MYQLPSMNQVSEPSEARAAARACVRLLWALPDHEINDLGLERKNKQAKASCFGEMLGQLRRLRRMRLSGNLTYIQFAHVTHQRGTKWHQESVAAWSQSATNKGCLISQARQKVVRSSRKSVITFRKNPRPQTECGGSIFAESSL